MQGSRTGEALRLSANERTASERVIETVAEREGVDPMDLDVPLFEAIDTDALDALVRTTGDYPGRGPVHVGFSYCGYAVQVTSDGTVYVTDDADAVDVDQ